MKHFRSNPTMPKVAATIVVVLLVLAAPMFFPGTIVVENLSSVTPRRSLSDSNQLSTVAIDMMHVDHHVDSPYMQPNLTPLQRAQNAAKRSKQRLDYFSGRTSGRRLTLASEENFTSPVFSEQGDYIMQLSIGTPARTLLAFVDTGSDLVWLQCTPCRTCFDEPDPLFDPTASSTYTPINCTAPLCLDLGGGASCSDNACSYYYSYGDMSYTNGSLAYETFTFTTSNVTRMAVPSIGFGCGTDQGGAQGSYDGLVGLGAGPLSLVSQLGSNIGPVFSYCLVSFASANTTTSPLLLGSAGTTNLTYTPLVNNSFYPTFYYVNLVGIAVNDVAVDYPADTFDLDNSTGSGGFILDSGTTVTQLVEAAYTPFQKAISALISYPQVIVPSFDLCYDTSSVSTPVFPTVVFQFEGVNLTMPSGNVFVVVSPKGIIYCMYIANGGPAGSISIFGNVQQQNFQIAYDLPNAQVGFAATTCS